VPQSILERDEAYLLDIQRICVPLADRHPAARVELQETERRLAVVALMRSLYVELRGAKERITSGR